MTINPQKNSDDALRGASDPIDDGHCFACGMHNPIGLHLHFRILEGEEAVECETTLGAEFAGWQGVAHGGIVMTVLDEAMAYAASSVGWRGVTAEASTRFREPIPLGVALRVRGDVVWQRRNVVGLKATIHRADDQRVLAQCEGKFVGNGRIVPGTLGSR